MTSLSPSLGLPLTSPWPSLWPPCCLQGSLDEGTRTASRADALTRDQATLRNNLAAAHKRVREAVAEAEAAGAAAAKAEEGKEKAEALARLARTKAEGLEREKYSAAKTARTERQTCGLIRRGVVAMAMRAALRRGDELRLASAVARWAVAALQPERGAPWWGLVRPYSGRYISGE